MKTWTVTIALAGCCYFAIAQQQKVDSFINAYTTQQHFNGTILIRHHRNDLYRQGFGFANFSFKTPNGINTRYRVASITKVFTAVLVLQLYEQKKIDLDKPIQTYLPFYQGMAGQKVSVRQLLNMTSGIRNMDEGVTIESALQNGLPQYQIPHTTEALLLNYCRGDSLVSVPGSTFDYNNVNYIILGKIIEQVSGSSFQEVLEEKILLPLKMESSGMLGQNIVDSLADTYFFYEDLKKMGNDVLPVYWGNWYASGSMYATAGDIAKFSDALFSGKLLKKETLAQMFVSGKGEYGLGVWVYKDYDINKKSYTIVKRPGSIMGAQAMLFHILEKDISIILLSNTNNVSMDDFAAEIAKYVVR